MENNQEPLLIKRYSSRRLYNTQTSEYTTLEDLADIVKSGQSIKVVDRETGEDLTRELLVRIIINNESAGLPVLPVDILMKIVQSYKEDSLAIIPKFFEATYSILNQSQSEFMKNVSNPVKGWVEFQKSQQEYLSNMFPFWNQPQNGSHKDIDPKKPNQGQSDLEAVKLQMTELQKKIDKLQG